MNFSLFNSWITVITVCLLMLSKYSNPGYFLQRISIACYAKRCTSYRKSVRPSVTRWHYVKTTQATIMGSSFLVVNLARNSKGNLGSECAEWERGRKNRKRCKIGPKLLLITNRKSHTRFRLVPKSSTLDDLERPKRTLSQKRCVFGAHCSNLNEDRPILSATKM